MHDRMAALVFRNRLVGGETQTLVAVFAPPAGIRRRTIVRINDVAGRATARAIIARMIVRSQKSEQRIVQPRFLQTEENRIGAIERAESALGQAARRFAGRFVDVLECPSCNCFSPPFSKMRRMFPGLLRLKRGSGSRNGRMPCSSRVLGRDRRVIDQARAERRPRRRPGRSDNSSGRTRRYYREPRPRASRRGSSCCDRRCRMISPWQRPQACCATRRSPGLMNRMNSGDS